MAHDPIPPTVDRGSSRHYLGVASSNVSGSPSGNFKTVPVVDETEVEGEEDDANEDAVQERPGLITTMSAAARDFRDAVVDETPADGVESSPSRKPPPKKKKRRRPSWPAFIVAILTMGPGWSEARRYYEEFQSKDEAVDEAAAAGVELGMVQGRLEEQSKNIERLAVKISANTASDLEARSNGAIEFRHLDEKLTEVHKGLDKLLILGGVAEADRPKLAATPVEITRRHNDAIDTWQALKEKATRDALERELSASDTVGR